MGEEDVQPDPGALGEAADVANNMVMDAPGVDGHDVGDAGGNDHPSQSLEAMPVAPGRHYNTRPKNDPHPARTARLAGRSHA